MLWHQSILHSLQPILGTQRCSCDFSRQSEVETQSSVMRLIFNPARQHHQYNYMSHLSL